MQLLHRRAGELALKDAFTFASLGFGLMGVFYAFEGDYSAPWFLALCVFFDWMDGRVARYTKTINEFGKHLDSLVDACSFGIAPAVIGVTLARATSNWLVTGAAIFFAICVATRLAWFNLQDSKKEKGIYHGVPSTHVSWLSVGTAALFGYEPYATAASFFFWGLMAVSGFRFSKAALKRAFGPLGFVF